jgi:hypothetical protein
MSARFALVMLVVALAGCGADKLSPAAREHVALLVRVPVYPGAAAPQTTARREFGARDWTLPARANAKNVIDWYVERLQKRGWKVTGRSFNTIRATRGDASLSVGVRRRALELIANSHGA